MNATERDYAQKQYELSNDRKGIEDSILPYLEGTDLEKQIHLQLLMATVPLPIGTIIGANLRRELKLESDEADFIHVLSNDLLSSIPQVIDSILATVTRMVEEEQLTVTLSKKETFLYNTKHTLIPDMKVKVKSLHAVLPMRIKPFTLENNTDNPHMAIKYKSLVTKQSVDDELPLNLEHINRMNSIPMIVSRELLPLLPDSKPPTKFELSVRFCAEQEHYFTHYYDSRGRTYCHGYYLSTQGTDLQKSLSVINDPQIIPLD